MEHGHKACLLGTNETPNPKFLVTELTKVKAFRISSISLKPVSRILNTVSGLLRCHFSLEANLKLSKRIIYIDISMWTADEVERAPSFYCSLF